MLRWVRPEPQHIRIDYENGRLYEPDFVVETDDGKYLCEVKRAEQVDDDDVRAKTRAAVTWCRGATQHAEGFGGKAWSYLLIPDTAISLSNTLAALSATFTVGTRGQPAASE